LGSIKIYSYHAPYAEDSDDILAEVAQWQLFTVFFCALLLKVDVSNEGDTEQDTLAAILVCVVAFGFMLMGVLTVMELYFAYEKHQQKKKDAKEKADEKLAKEKLAREQADGNGTMTVPAQMELELTGVPAGLSGVKVEVAKDDRSDSSDHSTDLFGAGAEADLTEIGSDAIEDEASRRPSQKRKPRIKTVIASSMENAGAAEAKGGEDEIEVIAVDATTKEEGGEDASEIDAAAAANSEEEE